MPAHQMKDRKLISSIQHAIDILNLFDDMHPELGNSDIADLLGLPKGTVAGLVYTLKANNYLSQNPANKKYRLGLKLTERAAVLLNQLDLRRVAERHLLRLHHWCDESVNLGIRENGEVVYIERLYGSKSLGIRSELGKRAPLHSTALGKAMLAFLPADDLLAFLNSYAFTPVTARTITDPQRFLDDLNRIRQLGFSLDDEENEIGGRCVAAPVFDHLRRTVAAVSVSVPIQRLPVGQIHEWGSQVKETARLISQELGYQVD